MLDEDGRSRLARFARHDGRAPSGAEPTGRDGPKRAFRNVAVNLSVAAGDRHAIETGDLDSPALELNRTAAGAAARHGVPFLDLHAVFEADRRANHRPFEHPGDSHWDEYGHGVVAAAIARRIAPAGEIAPGVDRNPRRGPGAHA